MAPVSRRRVLGGGLAGVATMAAGLRIGRGRSAEPDRPYRAVLPLVAADTGATTTLRQLADQLSFKIGAAPGWPILNAAFPDYTALIAREFNLFVLESGPLNWKTIHPAPDTYDFRVADRLIEFALNKGMLIQGHHLVWGNFYNIPDWLSKGSYSAAQLRDLIESHITTIVNRYTGRVHEWTVVNEPFMSNDLSNTFNWWYPRLGESYIDLAFEVARKADPSATLILNNTSGNESIGAQSNAAIQRVDRLKRRLLIDGYGMQMHLDGASPPKKSDVIQNMQRFKNLNVSVLVTECDVNLRFLEGTQAARFTRQAGIFRDMIEAALESAACRSFSVFNPGDKFSWLQGEPTGFPAKRAPNAEPTPWDTELRPKPAYFSLRDALAVAPR